MKKAMKACIGPSGKLLLLSQSLPQRYMHTLMITIKEIMQHMHGNILYVLDNWANLVVQLPKELYALVVTPNPSWYLVFL